MTTRATERAKRESNHPRFSRLSRGFAARRLCARALPLPPWKGKSFTSSTPSPFFYFFLSFQLSFINSSKNACYAHLSGHSNNSSIKLPDLYCKRRLCCVVPMCIFCWRFTFSLFLCLDCRSVFCIPLQFHQRMEKKSPVVHVLLPSNASSS